MKKASPLTQFVRSTVDSHPGITVKVLFPMAQKKFPSATHKQVENAFNRYRAIQSTTKARPKFDLSDDIPTPLRGLVKVRKAPSRRIAPVLIPPPDHSAIVQLVRDYGGVQGVIDTLTSIQHLAD